MGKKILVLCTGNSCRSQLAHGFLKTYAAQGTEIYSAGMQKDGVNPRAIEAMKEVGIDISNHTSNNVDEYTNLDFDYIVTLCDNARARCPYLPSHIAHFHQNFPDPWGAKGTQEEIAACFRNVRNQLDAYCKELTAAYLR